MKRFIWWALEAKLHATSTSRSTGIPFLLPCRVLYLPPRWCPSRRRLALLEEVETGVLTMLSKDVGRALRGYCPQSIREGLVSPRPLCARRYSKKSPAVVSAASAVHVGDIGIRWVAVDRLSGGEGYLQGKQNVLCGEERQVLAPHGKI